MSENIEIPERDIAVRVLRFYTDYKTGPKDEGARRLLDASGQFIPVDFVEYTFKGAAQFSAVNVPISHISKEGKNGEVAIAWRVIRPLYEAWKSGQTPVESGTPITAWPGLQQSQVDILHGFGVKTVEDLATLSDGPLSRIPLPGMRDIKKAAGRFLELRKDSAAEQRIANAEAETASLKEQMAALMRKLEPSAGPDDDADVDMTDVAEPAPRKKPGRPPKATVLQALEGTAA